MRSRLVPAVLAVAGSVPGMMVAGCADPAGTAPGRAGAAVETAPAPTPTAGGRRADGVVQTAGCAFATTTPAMEISGTPQPENQNRLDEVAGRLNPVASSRFPDVYASVELVQIHDRILVRRKPSASFDAWVLRDFARDCVEIVDARYSMVELRARADRISADTAYWRSRGVQINMIGPRPDKGDIEIGVSDVDKAKKLLPAYYGPGVPLEIVKAEPVTF